MPEHCCRLPLILAVPLPARQRREEGRWLPGEWLPGNWLKHLYVDG